MLKYKKGITAGTLVIIISVIAAFIIIASVIVGFMGKVETKEAELLCKTSIDARAASTMQVGSADVALAPVLCKTQDKEITGNREEIKSQLAYMMARCWWMFGEGRYEENLGDPDVIRKTFGVPAGENKCFLCYTTIIDETEIEGGTVGAREMYEYIQETDHRDIKGLKYLDYFQSYGGPGKVMVGEDIKAENAYGVVYLVKNKEESGGWWATAIATVAIAGTVICIIAEPCGAIAGVVMAGTAGFAGTVAYKTHKRNFYGDDERDVSVVILDHMKGIEAGGCVVKDLGGQ
ncbi:hypothetical protein HOA91_01005 [Candidatus Woesearchaeota archaeon]|jgi:hypothetical protein|nr:hypothetical protein [Candidatus Woesearchaeota archaeon]